MASSKAAGRLLYQFDLATRWSAHESLTAVARFRQFQTSALTHLADKEEAEQQILISYLPKSLTESEVDAALKAIYEEMKGQPKINLGQLKNKFFENPDYASTSPAVVISRAKELLQQQQKS
ncbi:hypothetical protein FRC02_007711 [Tulasnella sp. 418]|nr:hypothetical protein FRC02_007711 [Tulasnella sp. 418]